MPPVVQGVIHTRASRTEVVRALYGLSRLVGGGPGGAGGFVRALQVRVGLAVLARIKDAFVTKAAGGTDQCGERWKPLSPHTVAYTRPHPGLRRKRPFWETHPSAVARKKQRDRWWELYYRFKAKFRGDKSKAAAFAWTVFRLENPDFRSIMERYGGTKVQILRDRGFLFNSLSPGADADSAPMFPPHVARQVFRNGAGAVIIGTNRPHAGAHHRGVPGKIPRRRLWPEPAKWTGRWWSGAMNQFRAGVVEVIVYILGRIK